eukprot:scaffold28765_cov112-Isochrysis_galbana.AAC.2
MLPSGRCVNFNTHLDLMTFMPGVRGTTFHALFSMNLPLISLSIASLTRSQYLDLRASATVVGRLELAGATAARATASGSESRCAAHASDPLARERHACSTAARASAPCGCSRRQHASRGGVCGGGGGPPSSAEPIIAARAWRTRGSR